MQFLLVYEYDDDGDWVDRVQRYDTHEEALKNMLPMLWDIKCPADNYSSHPSYKNILLVPTNFVTYGYELMDTPAAQEYFKMRQEKFEKRQKDAAMQKLVMEAWDEDRDRTKLKELKVKFGG